MWGDLCQKPWDVAAALGCQKPLGAKSSCAIYFPLVCTEHHSYVRIWSPFPASYYGYDVCIAQITIYNLQFVGYVLGDLEAEDDDPGDLLTFSALGQVAGDILELTTVSPTKSTIKLKKKLDREVSAFCVTLTTNTSLYCL